MLYILLLISIVLNVLAGFLYRNWEYNFQQKLDENNLFEDNNVNIHMQRKGHYLIMSVSSKEINFSANHNLKEEKSSTNKVQEEKDIKEGKKSKKRGWFEWKK